MRVEKRQDQILDKECFLSLAGIGAVSARLQVIRTFREHAAWEMFFSCFMPRASFFVLG
jgi:hypothetical protein